MIRASCLFLIWCGLTVPFGMAAPLPDHPLTLAEALAFAQHNSPVLASVRSHLSAVQAGEVTAALRPNPVFTSASQDFNVFNSSKFDPVNSQEYTNSFAWTFERGGKRAARVEDARRGTEVAESALADNERQLMLQVKLTFTNLLFNIESLKLAEANLREYSQILEANRIRMQAGDISETDFDRIKIEEAQFQKDLLSARTTMLQTRSQLAGLLGIADSSKVEIKGELLPPTLPASLSDLQEQALTHRPDYRGAVRNIAKSQADVQLARANGAADILVAPEYKRNGPDNTIGVTFSFPVRLFDRNQGEKLRAARELEASRFAEQSARLQVLSDVQQGWDAYQAARERQKLYSEDYVKRSESILERMTFSFQHGATSLLDYLDTVRSHRNVALDALAANAQALVAIHQLSFATATELLP